MEFFLILLWALFLLLCIFFVLLARQVGILHQRIHPVGALLTNEKLETGDASPSLVLRALNGRSVSIGNNEESESAKSTLIFFMSPGCVVCKSLLPAIRSSSRSEKGWLDVIYATDGAEYNHNAYAVENKLPLGDYVVSEDLGRAFGVAKLPYAVLIDEKNQIASMGLINTQEQLESLYNAKDLNTFSIQDYLRSNDASKV